MVILEHVQAGNFLGRPVHCSFELYELMKTCWAFNKRDRPTFISLKQAITEMFEFVSNSKFKMSLFDPQVSDHQTLMAQSRVLA